MLCRRWTAIAYCFSVQVFSTPCHAAETQKRLGAATRPSRRAPSSEALGGRESVRRWGGGMRNTFGTRALTHLATCTARVRIAREKALVSVGPHPNTHLTVATLPAPPSHPCGTTMGRAVAGAQAPSWPQSARSALLLLGQLPAQAATKRRRALRESSHASANSRVGITNGQHLRNGLSKMRSPAHAGHISGEWMGVAGGW